MVTGFLARAGSLAVRPASLMCVLFPTFSDDTTLRRYPAYARRRPGTLSRCVRCRTLLESVAHVHAYTLTCTYTLCTARDFFPYRVYRMRVRVRIEVQQPPGPVGSREREKDGGRSERGRGKEKRKETYGASASTPPGRGSSFLGRPLARSVTGSTGILLERCVAIVEQIEESGSPVRAPEIAAPR